MEKLSKCQKNRPGEPFFLSIKKKYVKNDAKFSPVPCPQGLTEKILARKWNAAFSIGPARCAAWESRVS